MIPLVRTYRPERAVNLLLKRFRCVLVQAHYDNYTRIRFQADRVRDERVFFGKVPSQVKRWHERGGCLVSWRRVDGQEGENDAIVFAECPRSLEGIYASIGLTRHLAVVTMPPTWRIHEGTVAQRYQDSPNKLAKHTRRLTILRDMLSATPLLTRDFLDRHFSPAESSPPSPAPGLPAGAAPLSDMSR